MIGLNAPCRVGDNNIILFYIFAKFTMNVQKLAKITNKKIYRSESFLLFVLAKILSRAANNSPILRTLLTTNLTDFSISVYVGIEPRFVAKQSVALSQSQLGKISSTKVAWNNKTVLLFSYKLAFWLKYLRIKISARKNLRK